MMEKVLAIVGPTAIGKTAVAIKIAKELDGEIISCDSMQVYRGMDIGTAKPSLRQRSEIRHHLVDVVDVNEEFNVSTYQKMARDAISEISGKSKLPILVGGSGLYMRAVLDDLQFAEGELGSDIRKSYETDNDEEKLELWKSLMKRDPESANRIPYQNQRRVTRALEVIESSGELYSKRLMNWENRRSIYNTFLVGLRMKRERLYERIEERVDEMIHMGLLDEVRKISEENDVISVTAGQALGYKELIGFDSGDLGDVINEIKKRTRHLAKRQMTWFRGDDRINWIEIDEEEEEKIASDIIDLVSRRGFIVR